MVLPCRCVAALCSRLDFLGDWYRHGYRDGETDGGINELGSYYHIHHDRSPRINHESLWAFWWH